MNYKIKCVVCAKEVETNNRKRKFCDECLAKRNKEGVNYFYRRTVILDNGKMFRLTVKQDEIASKLAIGKSPAEVAKEVELPVKKIVALMEGDDDPHDFIEVVHARAAQYSDQIALGCMQAVRKLVKVATNEESIIICLDCKGANPSTAMFCSTCGHQLPRDEVEDKVSLAERTKAVAICMRWLREFGNVKPSRRRANAPGGEEQMKRELIEIHANKDSNR